MDLNIDEAQFDNRQARFVGVMLREVVKTVEAELDIEKRDAITAGESVVFALANVLDGTRKLTGKNKDIIPHLAFANTRKRDALVTSATGTSMHEYVHGWTTEAFSKFVSPIILDSDLRKVPIRPRAAMAVRVIERAVQVLDRVFQRSLPASHAHLLESVVTCLDAIAKCPKADDPLRLMASKPQEFDAIRDTLAPGSPERSLFLAVQNGARIASPTSINDIVSFSCSIGSQLKASKRDRLEDSLRWPAALDFKLIVSRIKSDTLDPSLPFDSDCLGTTWLSHEPDWTKYV